jgi:hypothetical protein
MKRSYAIKLAILLAPLLLSGCLEQEVSLRELRADIPELIIDGAGGCLKIYVMGIENYRYPRLELYVNGEKLAEEDQTLVLGCALGLTVGDELEIRAVAVTQSATYVHACSITIEENGIRLHDKSERLIEWKDMPYEIIMEAER